MKIKTSELQGAALDWAVAKCEAEPVVLSRGAIRFAPSQFSNEEVYSPSTDWAQGGPIIEWEGISVVRVDDDYETDAQGYCTGARIPVWCAEKGQQSASSVYGPQSDYYGEYFQIDASAVTGPTPLIAAMRCYVAGKLGDEVDVPSGLI